MKGSQTGSDTVQQLSSIKNQTSSSETSNISLTQSSDDEKRKGIISENANVKNACLENPKNAKLSLEVKKGSKLLGEDVAPSENDSENREDQAGKTFHIDDGNQSSNFGTTEPATVVLNGGNDHHNSNGSGIQLLQSDVSLPSLSVLPAHHGLPESTIPTPPDEAERSSSSTPEIPALAAAELTSNCLPIPSAISVAPAPILANGSGTLSGGHGNPLQVRSAINVPPGAKMVPVKAGKRFGEGNMRLVRVSPVKSSTGTQNLESTVSGVVPTSMLGSRTVVIKSSMIKSTVSAQPLLPACFSHQLSVWETTLVVNPSLLVTPTASPLPPQLVSSQPFNPNLHINTKDSGNTSTPPPTPPINSVVANGEGSLAKAETNTVSLLTSSEAPASISLSVPVSTILTSRVLSPSQL